MNKADLVDKMAAASGLTKIDTKKALDAFISEVSKALEENDKVTLVGFGTFGISERQERQGRNPRTGETMIIPAKKTVKFVPGAELKGKVEK